MMASLLKTRSAAAAVEVVLGSCPDPVALPAALPGPMPDPARPGRA